MKHLRKITSNRGMTYIELIVVLSIFSMMSGVVIYNYGTFQAKVDIKNLASDIALKVVEAQKSSLAGSLPQASVSSTWKPSYGVYFNIGSNPNVDNKSFIYFTDLNEDNLFTGTACTVECLEKINITKNNTISGIAVFDPSERAVNDLTISFSRPSSSAVFISGGSTLSNVSYVRITLASPKSPTGAIKVFPSGRVEID